MDDYFSRLRPQRTTDRVPAGSPFPQLETDQVPLLTPTIRLRRAPSRLAPTRPATSRLESSTHAETSSTNAPDPPPKQEEQDNRKRSFSEPQRPSASMLAQARNEQNRRPDAETHLSTLDEEFSHGGSYSRPQLTSAQTSTLQPTTALQPTKSQGRLRASSSAAWNRLRGRPGSDGNRRGSRGSDSIQAPIDSAVQDPISRREQQESEARMSEYNRQVVDLLDVIDPEVSTLTTLNNVQNSLFLPNLGRWLNRTATYDISLNDSSASPTDTENDTDADVVADKLPVTDEVPEDQPSPEEELEAVETPDISSGDQTQTADDIKMKKLKRTHTLTSVLSETERRHKEGEEHNFAVLPHGVSLDDWTDEDKDELNDHVRHLLHSRKEGFKRSMRGFGKYVRTPFGAFITIYASLLTFWGAAWVLFLIGWIYAGSRQAYFVEICDQILTALFALVGLGMAPFRAVDTYHMIYIAKYHYRTWEERDKRALPPLQDPNDLPEPTAAQAEAKLAETEDNATMEVRDPIKSKDRNSGSSSTFSDLSQNPAKAAAVAQDSIPPNQDVDLEAALPKVQAQENDDPNAVLTPRQWALFKHHQQKFQKSHTFYRPHETYTHHAFPIKLLITVVVLLDFHSIFQACLGGTTWGINYHVRPKALTAVILTCSICCNIAGGLTISIGDKKTRKKEVVEQLFRQEITKQAMRRLNRKKGLKIPKEAMKPTKEEVKEAKAKAKQKKELEKHKKEVKKLDADGQFGDKRGDLDEGVGGYIART